MVVGMRIIILNTMVACAFRVKKYNDHYPETSTTGLENEPIQNGLSPKVRKFYHLSSDPVRIFTVNHGTDMNHI